MSFISVRNLTRDYGRGRGIFDLSFSIEEGDVFGFLGPNGAGKTTTIRHLMGFLEPRRGKAAKNLKYASFFFLFNVSGLINAETAVLLQAGALLLTGLVLVGAGVLVFKRKDLRI